MLTHVPSDQSQLPVDRRGHATASTHPHLTLQRAAGNAAVGRYLARVTAPTSSTLAARDLTTLSDDELASEAADTRRWLDQHDAGTPRYADVLACNGRLVSEQERRGALPIVAGEGGHPCVFPNCFGDRIGSEGGAALGVLGGFGLLRILAASPMVVGWWRYVQIAVGVGKATQMAEEEQHSCATAVFPISFSASSPQAVLSAHW